MIRRTAYADGAPYRPPVALGAGAPGQRIAALGTLDLDAAPDWSALWDEVQGRLRSRGFQAGTLRVYRQVLRSFRDFSMRHQPSPIPPATAAGHIRPFLDDLVRREISASWLSLNISILRTVYDKFGGLSCTRRLRSPRRPVQLPEVLSEGEVIRLIAATPTARDRLLVGFLYGCGLRVGETCRLRWQDLDIPGRRIDIRPAGSHPARRVVLPESLVSTLAKGQALCRPEDPIFPGGRGNECLTARTVERLIRRAGEAAKLTKVVTAMTLRHSHAYHRLAAGTDVRTVQEDLGHTHVETTLRYQSLIHAPDTRAAVDRLSARLSLAGPVAASVPADFARRSPPVLSTPPAKQDFSLPPDALTFPLADSTFDWRAFLSGLRARLTSRFLALRARAGP